MKKEIKKNLERRLKIIAGQIHGLEKMVAEEKYCIDIITQSSAIRNALLSIENIMLENHLNTHVIEQIKNGKDKVATNEILKVFNIINKK